MRLRAAGDQQLPRAKPSIVSIPIALYSVQDGNDPELWLRVSGNATTAEIVRLADRATDYAR